MLMMRRDAARCHAAKDAAPLMPRLIAFCYADDTFHMLLLIKDAADDAADDVAARYATLLMPFMLFMLLSRCCLPFRVYAITLMPITPMLLLRAAR